MAHQTIDSLVVKELIARDIRVKGGDTTIILEAGRSLKIKDKTGFELFRFDKDSNNQARFWMNGVEVFK